VHAHAAGDPAATISDFQFSPSTTTIHVGETVTWTNNGPSLHTATAKDGSFNTGTLKKGASASHTFTQAGTFPYICAIHPFMHGTIVVLANQSSAPPATTTSASPPTASSASTAGSAGSGPGSSSAAAKPGLPVTGLRLPALLVLAIALLGLGLALRWLTGSARRYPS
jgi:hypothetical protein